VIPGGKDARAGREKWIDLPHQSDHLARGFFLRVGVASEVTLHVAIHALDSQRLAEILHHKADICVGCEDCQVFRGLRRRRSITRLLAENRAADNEEHNC